MKKIILLLSVLACTAAKAQSSNDTIKIPLAVAKQIAIELVSCDSTKSVLDVTQAELSLVREQSGYKDILLTNAASSLTRLNNQLANQQQQTETYKELYTNKKEDYETLSTDFKNHKTLRNYIDIVASIGVAIIIYLIAK